MYLLSRKYSRFAIFGSSSAGQGLPNTDPPELLYYNNYFSRELIAVEEQLAAIHPYFFALAGHPLMIVIQDIIRSVFGVKIIGHLFLLFSVSWSFIILVCIKTLNGLGSASFQKLLIHFKDKPRSL